MKLMKHILSLRVIRGKYSKWIVILQEYELEFVNAKAKKSLPFTELVSELRGFKEEMIEEEYKEDDNLFHIPTT